MEMDGMNGYEEDEPDGLVQHLVYLHYPMRLFFVQESARQRLRKSGFNTARKEAVRAFKKTLCSIYDPVFEDVESFCSDDQSAISSYFIPGTSAGDTAKRLSVASLVGPQVSQALHKRLKERIQKKKRYRWVALQPRECVSLAATVRFLAVNLADQASSLDIGASGLSSLGALSSSTTVVIYLRSIALHKYTVLNDFIKAIQLAAQASDYPHVVLLLGVEGGIGSLDDKVDSESMRLMDMHRISMPSPSIAFETMMQELFLSSNVEASIWLGPSVLELLRYQYYERGFDLDRVLSTMELAIHHHFSTRPMSAIAALSPEGVNSSDWEPVFFDRLRLHIVEADKQGMINLPRPPGDDSISKQDYLRSLLTDDDALLASMSDFASASALYRVNLQRAIHLLHTLRSYFLNQASNDDAEESLLEPRKAQLGGLAWHILSGQDVPKLISPVVGAMKKVPMRQLKEALDKIASQERSSEDDAFHTQMAAYGKEIQDEAEKETQEEADMEAEQNEKQRLETVQRRLLREESSDALKRKSADWIRVILDSWINTRPILSQVYTYDFSSYLIQICDPSPRGSILSALNDPSSSLDADGQEDDKSTPDICRLYQVYQSAGKMINLADLYQAFSQSIQTKKSKKRSRSGSDNDLMQRKDAVQARFALAVNEMGKMGFMKKTRRKPDHVLKIVHDLPATV